MPLAPAVTSTRMPLSSRSIDRSGMSNDSAGRPPRDRMNSAALLMSAAMPSRAAVSSPATIASRTSAMKTDRIALCQPFRIGAQIEIDHRPGFQPERTDDFDQDRRVRRFVNREMKTLVEFDRARQVGRRQFALGAHRLFGARDRQQIVVVAIQRGLPRRMALRSRCAPWSDREIARPTSMARAPRGSASPPAPCRQPAATPPRAPA